MSIERRIEVIPLEKIEEVAEDVRQMDAEEFNMLCESIEENGFVEPLQVVKYDRDGEVKYRIVNGQHRFTALRDVFGVKEFLCMVVGENWDEERYWSEVFRLNSIKGEFDPVAAAKKLMELREKLKDKYDLEAFRRRLGLRSRDALFNRVFGEVKKALPKEIGEKLEQKRGKIETIEDLSTIISEIIEKHGRTLDKHFLVFTIGGKEHLLVKCTDELWNVLMKMREEVESAGKDMAEELLDVLSKTYIGVNEEGKVG